MPQLQKQGGPAVPDPPDRDLRQDDGRRQIELFSPSEALARETHLEEVMLSVRRRYGMNALVRGMNLEEGGTTIERNQQIGGHRAGTDPLPRTDPAPEKPVHPPLAVREPS